MTVQGEFRLNLGLRELIALSSVHGPTSIDWGWNLEYQLGAATAVPADQGWHDRMALIAGALTFSLEALPRTGRTALDLTGLEVTHLVIVNPATNANSMTFTTPVSNGYPIFPLEGEVIAPGGARWFYEPAGFGVVGATLSDIDVSGTAVQQFEMLIVAADLT